MHISIMLFKVDTETLHTDTTIVYFLTCRILAILAILNETFLVHVDIYILGE